MSILIDDRAGSKDLISLPPLNTLSTLCRLESADILMTGNGPTSSVLIGIELKSIADLISSSSTGRLQATQLPLMLDQYDINYLLYYGIYRPHPESQALQILRGKSWRDYSIGQRIIPYSYIESFLLTVSSLGVRIKHCSTISDCAQWLGCLYRWWQKPWSDHKGLRTFDNSQSVSLLPGLDPQVHQCASVAIKLPGLGFERALAAAYHFEGSILDMVNAPISEWERIPGIGKVIAKTVTTALRTKTGKMGGKTTKS